MAISTSINFPFFAPTLLPLYLTYDYLYHLPAQQNFVTVPSTKTHSVNITRLLFVP